MHPSVRRSTLTSILVAAGIASAEYSSDGHTVALWKFDDWRGASIPDRGPGSLDLPAGQAAPLVASPEDSAAVLDGSLRFTLAHTPKISVGATGQLTYQARIWLDEYPPAANHNQYGFLMGKYEGMGLFIRSDGRLSVNNQKGDGSSWMWYAPVTAKDVVPLRKWVEVAAACDQAASECYVYVDGKAQATYSYMLDEWFQPFPSMPGNQFRSPASPFTLGYNERDGQPIKAKVEAVKISDSLVLGHGPRIITTKVGGSTHFPLLPSTVALWAFDSYWITGSVPNFASGYRFTLQSNSPLLEDSPYGRAARCDGMGCAFSTAGHSALTIGGTGILTLEARIWLDEYPSTVLHNKAAAVAGMYEGLKLLIFADGRIQAAGQRKEGDTYEWFAPISRTGAVPLKKWVDVAVAADQGGRQMHAWVDGVPVQLYVPAPVDSYRIDGFRSPASPFTVGMDAQDGQYFKGRLEEVRVSDTLVLGQGLDLLSDPDIMKDTVPVKPVTVKVNVGLKTHYAKAGDTVWAPILLTNFDMVSISACQFDLNLDTSVAVLLDVSLDSGLAKGWQLLDWNRKASSPVAIAMGGADRPLAYGEGELARLKILVKPSAKPEAVSRLELTRILLDENVAIVPTHTPGKIVVARPKVLYGDVTGNGQVEVQDAVKIQECVVGRITLPDPALPSFTLETADVSGNGEITSYDAALVFQFAMGLISGFPVEGKPAPKAAAGAFAEAGLSVGNAMDAGNGTFHYRIQGTGLAGLVAGEIALVLDHRISGIAAVTTAVPSARLTWRHDPVARMLFVSLTANDPVKGPAIDLIEIEAIHEAGMTGRGLDLASAYLNEGRLEGAGLPSKPLAVRKGIPDGQARALRPIFRGGELHIPLETGVPAQVDLMDARGRLIYSRSIPAGSEGLSFSIPRSTLPMGMVWIRVASPGMVRSAPLVNLRP